MGKHKYWVVSAVCTVIAVLIFLNRPSQGPTDSLPVQNLESPSLTESSSVNIEEPDYPGSPLSVRCLPEGVLLIQYECLSALIDCGRETAEDAVLSALADAEVTELEYLFVSNANPARAGVLQAILDAVSVETVITPSVGFCDEEGQFAYETVAAVEHPSAGVEYMLGEIAISILHPAEELGLKTNDASLVIMITYGSETVLVPSDIGSVGLEILKRTSPVDADVLILSGTSSAFQKQYMEAIMPSYIIAWEGITDLTAVKYGEAFGGSVHFVSSNGMLIELNDGAVRISSDA